jgi:hypothetical protein
VITVAILINGNPIMARSAVNKGEASNGHTRYQLDDGTSVLHKSEEGAVVLAKKLLNSIKEGEE